MDRIVQLKVRDLLIELDRQGALAAIMLPDRLDAAIVIRRHGQ